MIGRISGTLLEKQAPDLLVDVGGIGYELQGSLNTFFDLPEPGARVVLHTHFVVREDAQQLFGFASLSERALFRSLIRVSGVGPRLALAILSGMTATDFIRCVQNSDTATLVRLPGVGKKTADRLLVEMRDRIEGWEVPAAASIPGKSASSQQHAIQEAESALVSLGYKPQEAARMVSAVVLDDSVAGGSQAIIRDALKNAVKKT